MFGGLDAAIARARTLEGDRVAEGGAAFFETIAFWGLPDNSTFGWRREGAKPGEVLNPYIRHYRSGSIELLAMALERHAHRPDERFVQGPAHTEPDCRFGRRLTRRGHQLAKAAQQHSLSGACPRLRGQATV